MIGYAAYPDTAQQANELLELWRMHDVCRLERELDQTTLQLQVPAILTAEEEERRELLSVIADQMRYAVDRRRPGDGGEAGSMEVCLGLLQHLRRGASRI
jgi:hypothetical protein